MESPNSRVPQKELGLDNTPVIVEDINNFDTTKKVDPSIFYQQQVAVSPMKGREEMGKMVFKPPTKKQI